MSKIFADPGRCVVLLIHPEQVGRRELCSHWDVVVALIAKARAVFGVRCYIVGERDDAPMESAPGSVPLLNIDPLSLWREGVTVRFEAIEEVDTIFIGGLWLDEDVVIAALSATERGYDVRLLADLSPARVEAHRQLAYDRLALHGIPVATCAQMLLEWAMARGDQATIDVVRNLLNEEGLLSGGRPGGLS